MNSVAGKVGSTRAACISRKINRGMMFHVVSAEPKVPRDFCKEVGYIGTRSRVGGYVDNLAPNYWEGPTFGGGY